MTNILVNFLQMGGYGLYVWAAYGMVLTVLAAQWFFPWRRWRKYLHTQPSDNTNL
jgi:heme exporter protein CcmD